MNHHENAGKIESTILPWRTPIICADFKGRQIYIGSRMGSIRELRFSEKGRYLGQRILNE